MREEREGIPRRRRPSYELERVVKDSRVLAAAAGGGGRPAASGARAITCSRMLGRNIGSWSEVLVPAQGNQKQLGIARCFVGVRKVQK